MPGNKAGRMKIERASEIGFCSGVSRAISILEKIARERGGVETLGAVVHNQQVLQGLAEIGIRVANSVDDIQGNMVAISCHGVATVDEKFIANLGHLPHRLGILSQTTQVPAHFTEFTKKLIDSTFTMDSELRVIDTICHDIRKRQTAALKLANRVDLMLVIGGRNSANTNRLAELCSTVTETHLIETAEEIQPSWLQGQHYIGITGGASTAEQTINEALTKLEGMTQI